MEPRAANVEIAALLYHKTALHPQSAVSLQNFKTSVAVHHPCPPQAISHTSPWQLHSLGSAEPSQLA